MHSINFTDQLIQNVDQPISLNSMKGAQDAGHPIKTSPLTRSPILGGLCLGAAEDHVKATNWVISRLMAGGKCVGNMDQWFALFWYLVENKHIQYLEPILPKIRQHMIYRLQKHFGTASLSFIPYICQTALPVGICCWFAMNIYSDRFLALTHQNVPVFIQMSELAGYEFKPEIKRKLLIDSAVKTVKVQGEEALPSIFKLCYATTDEYPNIIVDGPVNDHKRKEALKKLPIVFSDIPINILRIAINHVLGGTAEEDIEDVNWGYGLKPCVMPKIEICPATLRPYLLVPPSFIPWKKAATRAFHSDKQLINCHAQYINYVNKIKSFPTKQELADFCMKMIVPKKNFTLPVQIGQFMDCVVDTYNQIINQNKITPLEFNDLTNKSLYIKQRARIELKFYQNQNARVTEDMYDCFTNNKNKSPKK